MDSNGDFGENAQVALLNAVEEYRKRNPTYHNSNNCYQYYLDKKQIAIKPPATKI